MSSTRVKERQGLHLDFYETPEKVVAGLFEVDFFEGDISNMLEPSAGKGAIVKAVRKKKPDLKITAVEIQEDFASDLAETGAEFIIGDFLKSGPSPIYDTIVANPPYSQAENFIRHAFEFLSPSGKMAFLLRLPFLASVKRYDLFKELRPIEVNVLSQRPKFGGNNIDSCDYAWIVWKRNPSMSLTSFNWIAPTDNRHPYNGQACGA